LRADLMARGVYDFVGDDRVLAAAMTQYIGLLGESDQYLTISTPRFWRPGNPGSSGEFLSMNMMAAWQCAVIKRLFVIAPDDLKNKYFQQIMDTHVRTLREVEGLA